MPKVDFSELSSLKELEKLGMSKKPKKLQIKDPSKIWQVIHFYLQPGDSLTQVRKDARETISHRGENILAVAHNHIFGESCSKGCKTYRGEL